jgi:hypothetical protein
MISKNGCGNAEGIKNDCVNFLCKNESITFNRAEEALL